MSDKFINILPELIKRYKENDDKLFAEEYLNLLNDRMALYEELETRLLEYKLPKPLAMAYKNSNIVFDGSRYKHVSDHHNNSHYPNATDTVTLPNHGEGRGTSNALDIKTDFNYTTKNRGDSYYDFGKANYDRVSKSEALRKLGLKVYRKPSPRSKEETWTDELSMEEIFNDYLPDANLVGVKDADGLCQENISRFRFLHKKGDGYVLSEFTYTNDGRYFPVVGETIPYDNFRKYKVNLDEFLQGVPRADMAPGHNNKKNPKCILYIIKLADLIYETDEYDSKYNLKDMSSGAEITASKNKLFNIKKVVQNICKFEIFKFYLNEFLKTNENSFDNIEELKQDYPSFFTNIHNDVIGNIISLYNDYYENPDNFRGLSVLDSILDQTYNYRYNTFYFKSNEDFNRFKDMVKTNTIQEFKEIKKVLDTQDIYQTIEDAILNEIPESRIKELLQRKLKRSKLSVIQARNDEYEHQRNMNRTSPATALANASDLSIEHPHDTGNHNPSQEIAKMAPDLYFNDDIELNKLYRRYISFMENKKLFKQKYIAAQRAYNRIKKNSHYYDSVEEYQFELSEAKKYLLSAKANYEGGYDPLQEIDVDGVLTEIKNFTRKYFKVLDQETKVKEKQFMRLVYYIEFLNNKIKRISSILGQIETYSEDEVLDYYGSSIKDELNSLKSRCENLERTLNSIIQSKESKIRRKEELLRELEQLELDINDLETRESQFTEQIKQVTDEINNFNIGIESAVEKCYIQQAELVQSIDEIGSIIKNEIASAEGKEIKPKQVSLNKKLENILVIKDDIKNIEDELPKVVQDELEDVLSDPDEDE